MRHSLAIAAAAVAFLTGPALAQTQTAPATPAAGSAAMPAGQAGAGMRMADTASVAVRFVTVKSADLMSSKLIGTNVYNKQNESIGEIEDLVIENGKTITGVVVSVGGFLGMGERYVLLDPASIVLNSKDGNMKAFVDTNKENLKSAPTFKYTKKRS